MLGKGRYLSSGFPPFSKVSTATTGSKFTITRSDLALKKLEYNCTNGREEFEFFYLSRIVIGGEGEGFVMSFFVCLVLEKG